MLRSVRASSMVLATTMALAAFATGGVPPAAADSAGQPVLVVGSADPSGGGDVDSFDSWVPGPRGVVEPAAAFSAPTVLDDGDRTMLWFCGTVGSDPSAIGLKTSTDHGRSWPWTTSYSLLPTPGGTDTTGACDPSAVRFGDYYYLAYQADDGPDTQLFVARASVASSQQPGLPSLAWRWQKWTGSGWSYDGSPAPLATGPYEDATAPSLVIADGVLSVFYTEPVAAREDVLRVVHAPLTDDWPARIGQRQTVLVLPDLTSALDVKYDDAEHEFVAAGVAGTQVVAYAGPGGSSQFAPLVVDDLDDASNQAGSLALAGDASGHLGSFVTYTLPDAAGNVRLHRSAVALGTLPTGTFADGFASPGTWLLQSTYPAPGWGHDAALGGALTYASTQGSQGTAVAQAWDGDGLYQLTLHSTDPGMLGIPGELQDVGLQIARQKVHGSYTDSGYTVMLGDMNDGGFGHLQLIEGGHGLVGSGSYMPTWPYPSKTQSMTINIEKYGAHLDFWPSWPGDPNPTHQYGGSAVFPGAFWQVGHPALVVDTTGTPSPGHVRTAFDGFRFTPLGQVPAGPGPG